MFYDSRHPYPESRRVINHRCKRAVSLFLLLASSTLYAQTESHPAGSKGTVKPDERPLFYPDVEFLASTQFRDAFFILPVWKKLNFEGHYFGDDHHDVGLIGGSWAFEFARKVTISPGLAVGFGTTVGTAPAATLRWDVEHSWFHGEGFSSISLRAAIQPKEEQGKTEFTRYSYISDGNHLSGRWKRIESGFFWEHIATREENEWKTGGRLAVALTRHLDFVAYLLAPDTEFRCGLHFHPPRRER
jgi:hypothetical protein